MTGVWQWIMSRLHNSEDGLKLLGLLMAAERPLRWREAQALFCIEAEKSTIDDSGRDRSVQAREFCGGVVDIYRVAGDESCSEEMIRILHPKIKESLSVREPGMINIGLEHAKLSRFCSEYLTSQRFRAGVFAEKVMTWEDIEFYEPLDYTVQHWYHHAKATIEAYRVHTEYGEAIKSLGTFLLAHMRGASYWNGKSPKSIQDVLELFEHIHEDAHERNLQLRLESRVSFIRRQIENLYWNKVHSWEKYLLAWTDLNRNSFSSAQNYGAPSSLGVLQPSRIEMFIWSVTRDPFIALFKNVLRMSLALNLYKACTVTTGGRTSLHSY
ncbi:hypothetical protein NW759_004416 [Fusarium solani]|nr:hypothetical protein NW759_004416 [Fusarium solani]